MHSCGTLECGRVVLDTHTNRFASPMRNVRETQDGAWARSWTAKNRTAVHEESLDNFWPGRGLRRPARGAMRRPCEGET